MLKYSESLNCLFVQTKFSDYNFWNFGQSSKMIGAKAIAPPLGLLTVAALVPQTWNLKLIDLNAYDFDEELWNWADLVCVGGMLPQQKEMLEIIARAKKEGKFVAVGGADPTCQPDVYKDADALILGEGEITIPLWIEAFKQGQPCGIFESPYKADMTLSPPPRLDLIKAADYYNLSLQYSRGCPFNCEFCEVVELFGRKQRAKTPEQVLKELDAIYELGHRGHVDIVDDNFVGNIKEVKTKLLPALIMWNRQRGYPFYFSVEVSLNLAEDRQVLKQMQSAGFRQAFVGIETPDPEVLMSANKKVNAKGSILDRLSRFYEYGLVPAAGFILGFDGEKDGTDKAIIEVIEKGSIAMAMVGLLVALPKTQLTRRLKEEGRLYSFAGMAVEDNNDIEEAKVEEMEFDVVDQTAAGLNFRTTRDRKQILKEFDNIIAHIYTAENYMGRIVDAAKRSKLRTRSLPDYKKIPKLLLALLRMCIAMTKDKKARKPFWKSFWQCLFLGQARFEMAMTFMGCYFHFAEQTEYLLNSKSRQNLLMKFAENDEKTL